MNAGDVVKLLKDKDIVRTEASVKFLAHKYNMYLTRTNLTPRPGLDPAKAKDLVKVLSSNLLLANIAATMDVSLSQVDYYIKKGYIHTKTQYGRKLLKNEKDLEYVRTQLQK